MKKFSLEEIRDEYRYGNYQDDPARLCGDAARYIADTYGLSYRHSLIVVSVTYNEKKNNIDEFFTSIELMAKIAIKIRDDIQYRVFEQLKATFEM